jgi:hypothetical protein
MGKIQLQFSLLLVFSASILAQVPFDAHTIVGGEKRANGAWSVFAADMDGDGDLDVLSASEYDDKIAWYENDGQQNFTSHTITTDAGDAQSVYAVDVDGDGDMDVLSASRRMMSKIAWYENDGRQHFTSHVIYDLCSLGSIRLCRRCGRRRGYGCAFGIR